MVWSSKPLRVHRFQFGLRSMLLVVLIAGSVLGMGIKWHLDRGKPKAYVAGRVTLEDGAAVRGFELCFDGPVYGVFVTTEDDGTFAFAFAPLEPDISVDGDYSLVFSKDDDLELAPGSQSVFPVKEGRNAFDIRLQKRDKP